jgi:hypothetical protein
MIVTEVVNCALIWPLLLLCTPLAAAATMGPQAQVPETTLDFGEVFEIPEVDPHFFLSRILNCISRLRIFTQIEILSR